MQLLWFIGLGIAYLAVAAVVTVVVIKIAGGARSRQTVAGFLSAATFLLLPTWDIIPGQRYFKHLCRTEAGLKIYKTIEAVEGFREYSGGPASDAVEKYGYRFIETERPGVGLLRFMLDAKGNLIKEHVTKPISRYAVRETREALFWNVLKVQKVISDEQTQEQLATWTTFYYSGNWLQTKWYVAAYEPCGLGFGKEFFVNVLKPSL